MRALIPWLKSLLGPRIFYTLGAWIFGLFRVRMIWYLGPRVVQIDENRVEIRIPLGARSRNHLGSMYIGALWVGADVAGGMLAASLIIEKGLPISFVFANSKAQYFKRPEADVHFVSEDGPRIAALIQRAMASEERHSEVLRVVALVPEKLGTEPVAEFELTLSVKRRPGVTDERRQGR